MSIQNEFTPEQLQALLNGETISFSKKQGTTVSSANKNAQKEDVVDVAEDQQHTSVTPRASIAINGATKVTKPSIRDNSGEVVNPGAEKIRGWSPQADKAWDKKVADQQKAREELQAIKEAEERVKAELTPAQILNKLNATHRVVEKLQRDIAALKKQQSN